MTEYVDGAPVYRDGTVGIRHMEILDAIFPNTPEPTAERCSVCRRWFRSEELDFCRQCGQMSCIGDTLSCEACEGQQCRECFAGPGICVQCADRGARVS